MYIIISIIFKITVLKRENLYIHRNVDSYAFWELELLQATIHIPSIWMVDAYRFLEKNYLMDNNFILFYIKKYDFFSQL